MRVEYLWLGTVSLFVFGFLARFAVAQSLMTDPVAFAGKGALIAISAPGVTAQTAAPRRASLFADKNQDQSLFRPFPVRLPADALGQLGAPEVVPLRLPGVAGLRDLIAIAEAGPAGYDAVVWNARVKPPKPPTAMTIAEIYRWIDQTPGQNHAIGRYQFIPKTLRRVVAVAGVSTDDVFTPQVQDRLSDVLLADAGLSQFMRGEMARVTFMNNLAKIWAGLPNSTGKSHYHGYAGNKASISWAKFERAMAQIFPA